MSLLFDVEYMYSVEIVEMKWGAYFMLAAVVKDFWDAGDIDKGKTMQVLSNKREFVDESRRPAVKASREVDYTHLCTVTHFCERNRP